MAARKKLGQFVKSSDLFGDSVRFSITGRASFASYLGAFLSLAIIVITISYATNRY